jgi:serine/threonine protein phosphatase PrpC
VANLGDSRAVASVGGLAKQLTQDHNTSNPRERDRVTAMGGIIKDNRVGGVLMPTRSVNFTIRSVLKMATFFHYIVRHPLKISFKRCKLTT